MNAYLFLVIALVLNAAANLLIKYAAIAREGSGSPPAAGLAGLVQTYVSVPFVLGVLCFGLNLLAYTQALKKLPISAAYPIMVSVGYLMILAVSWFLFHERMAPPRYIGAGFMLLGLWLLVR
ncbi:MAG: EamA family transporter [Candidatus Eisenbacteria sp.]|nr:EamA family transporter [Candidatus Eisenbacteria bacterium]